MIRFLLVAFLTAAWSSCSLFGTDSEIGQIWVNGSTGATPTAARINAIDTERYYSVRGRNPRMLSAYDLTNGELVWSQPAGPCTPAIVAGPRIFCPTNLLRAFDARSGEILWTYTPSRSLSSTYNAADDERVYVSTYDYGHGLEEVIALDAATGEVLWQRTVEGDWTQTRMRSLTLVPSGELLVAFEGEFVLGQIFSVAVVVALDPATGEELWRYIDGDETTDNGIGGLTVWEDLILYSATTGQEAVAFDIATREVVWRVPFLPNAFSGLIPPVVKDGIAYFSDTQGGLQAVDARTGAVIWSTERDEGFFGHAVCGDVVLGISPSGQFVRRDNGKLVGYARPRSSDDVIGQVAVADDVLYLSADSGVYAYDCRL